MHRQIADAARAEIARLVDKFEGERNLAQSEADVRTCYIDLLFHAIGWNVFNDPGQITNYRREGYVRGAGFVDVGLEQHGQPVLFLEAKRFGRIPSSVERTGDRTIEEKQAFRYARGKKITYAILANFERLHIFNADHERLIYAFDHPQDYLRNFDVLWRLSPAEVERGSLPWWEGQPEKKDVDLEFLAALRRWRRQLANAIYEHNASNSLLLHAGGRFDFDQLMAAVQRVLDRLILIRYGDDKEVLLAHDLLDTTLAEYRNRGAYARPDHLMRAFADLSHMMDQHHNTTLFASGHVCEQVVIPNETLAQVIEEMNSISFRKFTSDILGSTYESYLGTKLVLRNGQVEDEERRDVRKGSGIYYTPRWVVQYIVDSTLGRRLKELEGEHGLHAIEKVRGLAILDPACGSGSFLICAYQVLAEFYRRLNENIAQQQARLLKNAAQFHLFETLEDIKHLPQPIDNYPDVILQEHLFGVDGDPEAAEIAAVNLTMQAFADSRHRKLPLILNENIKVGNSLISGTEAQLRPYFGDDWRQKRPFDWTREFPEVMGRGGFDVVIGNPPWGGAIDSELKYFHITYPSSTQEHTDSYKLFVDRGLQLLRPEGLISMIVPNTLLRQRRLKDVRSLMLGNRILALVDLGEDVFDEVIAPSCIFTVENVQPALGEKVQLLDLSRVMNVEKAKLLRDPAPLLNLTDQSTFEENPDLEFMDAPKKAAVSIVRLGDFRELECKDAGINYQRVNVGMQEKGKSDLSDRLLYEGERQKPNDQMYWRGSDIDRYWIAETTGHFCRTNYRDFIRTNEVVHLSEQVYNLAPKILLRQTADHIIATIDYRGVWFGRSIIAMVPTAHLNHRLEYLLALLNSRYFRWLYHELVHERRRVFAQVKVSKIKQLPLRPINFTDLTDKSRHDLIVILVERMLELHKRKAGLSLPQAKLEDVDQLIASTDREIDSLVYDLYGLTEEERRLVEEATGR